MYCSPRPPFTPKPQPLKHVRYPWKPKEKPMTICIAAACEDNGKPLIVLCADTKTSFYDGLTNTGGYTKMQIPLPVGAL